MADTKRTILAAIRDQLRGNTSTSETTPKWTSQHWWESFQYLFVHACGINEQHHDDLLFFVRSSSTPGSTMPFFVRRRAAQLPEDLLLSGKEFGSVDWQKTVILNLVLQSQYQLTVVACGREALPFVAEGRTWTADMRTVAKPVFASATETDVNLDSSRASASNPAACYPDVCFAVDDFEEAFGEMVLQESEQCYCVVLHALLNEGAESPADPNLSSLVPAAASTPKTPGFLAACEAATATTAAAAAAAATADPGGGAAPNAANNTGAADSRLATLNAATVAAAADAADTGTPGSSIDSSVNWKIGTRKRTLFAGFVSYQQIHEFINSGSSSSRGGASVLDSLLGQSSKSTKDKVVMTGPGGTGRAEVAVTRLQRRSNSVSGGPMAGDGSTRGDAGAPAAADQQVIPPELKQPGSALRTAHSAPALDSAMAAQQPSAASMTGQPAGAAGGGAPTGLTAAGAGGDAEGSGGFISRGLLRARQVATGLQRLVGDFNSSWTGASAAPSNLRCALMMLKLPVQYVAREILEGLC